MLNKSNPFPYCDVDRSRLSTDEGLGMHLPHGPGNYVWNTCTNIKGAVAAPVLRANIGEDKAGGHLGLTSQSVQPNVKSAGSVRDLVSK